MAMCAALMASTCVAALPKRVKATADAVTRATTVAVSFKTQAGPGSLTLGDGGKFVLDLGDAKIYYDGKTQWAYSVSDREVTQFEPTAEELEQGNPAAILASLASAYDGKPAGANRFELTPKGKSSDVKSVILAYPASGTWPQEMIIEAQGQKMVISQMNFKTEGTKRPLSTFQFKAPKGVKTIKL